MLAPKGRVWQTEHKCGNYNFSTPYWDQSRYDPNKAQNDHLYGEESWQLIRDWIVAGVNAYSAWNMVLDTVGKSLGNWPQNALLVVDRSAKKLIVTPAYYAFRHFSQYVAPGATRIKISGSTDAVAFKNPDGSIITEVYNKGSSSKTTTVAHRQRVVPVRRSCPRMGYPPHHAVMRSSHRRCNCRQADELVKKTSDRASRFLIVPRVGESPKIVVCRWLIATRSSQWLIAESVLDRAS